MKTLLDTVWLFIAKKIKPFSGTLLGIIGTTVALWSFAEESLFQFLCKLSDTFSFLMVTCNIGETKFYSIMVGLMGVLITIQEKLHKMNEPQSLKIAGIEAPGWLWLSGLLSLIFIGMALVKTLPIVFVIVILFSVAFAIFYIINLIAKRQ